MQNVPPAPNPVNQMNKKLKLSGLTIGLVILCVILLVATVGVEALSVQTSNSLQAKNSDLQQQLDNLASQNSAYVNNHSHTNDEWEATKNNYNNYYATHSHTDDEYNNLQSSLNSLQSTYSGYQASHSHTDTDYNSQSSQLSTANSINNLQKSTVWLPSTTVNQNGGSYVYYTYSANYAGYVSVNVQSSTTTNQYIEVVWSANGVSYDNKVTVGNQGTAVFPVLPANVQIRIGNTNLLNGATATLTITYVY